MILRGSTLNQWSKEHGFGSDYAHRALIGTRRGPKARRIVQMIRKELGL